MKYIFKRLICSLLGCKLEYYPYSDAIQSWDGSYELGQYRCRRCGK